VKIYKLYECETNKQTLKTEGSDWVKDEDLAVAGRCAGAATAMRAACADEARAILLLLGLAVMMLCI
jgi:dienelactone hydrolase